jgi:hypothetical protein
VATTSWKAGLNLLPFVSKHLTDGRPGGLVHLAIERLFVDGYYPLHEAVPTDLDIVDVECDEPSCDCEHCPVVQPVAQPVPCSVLNAEQLHLGEPCDLVCLGGCAASGLIANMMTSQDFAI